MVFFSWLKFLRIIVGLDLFGIFFSTRIDLITETIPVGPSLIVKEGEQIEAGNALTNSNVGVGVNEDGQPELTQEE